jgi:hypothetical protein
MAQPLGRPETEGDTNTMSATTTTTKSATPATPAVVRIAEDVSAYVLLDIQRQRRFQAMPPAQRRTLCQAIAHVGRATVAEARASSIGGIE